jgi:hypothetical protein
VTELSLDKNLILRRFHTGEVQFYNPEENTVDSIILPAELAEVITFLQQVQEENKKENP